MRLDRTGWLGVLLLALLAVGALFALRWPGPGPSVQCPPADLRWVDAGSSLVAVCAPHAQAADGPAAQRLTLGARLELNRASAEDLALIPGIGPKLSAALVEARERQGGFTSWDEVGEVPGIGRAKLEAIRQAADLDR